jgi:hypothetical protein
MSTYGHSGRTPPYSHRAAPTNRAVGVQTPPSSPPHAVDSVEQRRLPQPVPKTTPALPTTELQDQPENAVSCGLPTPRSSLDSPHSRPAIDKLYKQITNHLASSNLERLELSLPIDDYIILRDRLETCSDRVRVNYDFINEWLVAMPNPSPVQESLQNFFITIVSTIQSKMAEINPTAVVQSLGPQSTRLMRSGRQTHDKGADLSLNVMLPGQPPLVYPTFVVEVGYSESWDELIEDAIDWLCGTDGHILAALAVKFVKPEKEDDFSDVEKWEGWMQLYVAR